MAQSRQRSNKRRPNQRRRSSSERRVSGLATLPPPEGPLLDLPSDRARNQAWPTRAAVVVGVGIGFLAFLLAVPADLIVAIVLGVLVGIGAGLVVIPATLAAANRNLGGVAVELDEVPRVASLLDVLGATFGVAPASLRVIEDPVPNAAMVASKDGVNIVLTTGLLSSLTLIELEGVLGHLLARQRLDAVRRSSVGAGLALLLGPIGRRPAVAHRLIGEGGLFRADEIAAVTVRYPVGLADALGKMIDGPVPASGSLFSSSVYDSTRWLFVDPSIARRSSEEMLGDVDATTVRREALSEW